MAVLLVNHGARMSDDELLAQHFPVSPETFRALRDADADFNTICSDYLELAHHMAVSIAREEHRKLRLLADMANAISSLSDEISEKLRNSQLVAQADRAKDQQQQEP